MIDVRHPLLDLVSLQASSNSFATSDDSTLEMGIQNCTLMYPAFQIGIFAVQFVLHWLEIMSTNIDRSIILDALIA